MKIAIMGAGAVGGYYGGLLARAGHEVTFIARGAHLEAIRAKGLQVKSVFGGFSVSPAGATDRASEIGTVELVIVSTKTYHTDDAAKAIRTIVGPETVVVSFQNGVDAADRIGAIVGREHLIGGATWLSAAVEAPGVIGQYSQFRRIVLGEFNGEPTPRIEKVADALRSTGADVELSVDILKVLWTKFAFIASVSAIGSLTRVTFGEFRGVSETRTVLSQAIAEVAAVAKAKGAHLDEDVVEKTLAFIDAGTPAMKPSMQRDIEAGRVSELESMVGVVVRLAEELAVPAPVMGFAYAMLKPGLVKARGGSCTLSP